MDTLNNRGSLWRKWDLHIHTPESLLNNQFGDWDEYIEALEKLEDVAVLGITDYYSIEGYKKIKAEKAAGKLSNIDCILPNIEMRLNYEVGGKTPDLHIIFSEEVEIEHIEQKFLNELEIEMHNRSYRCNKDDLISLGKETNDELLDETNALKEGYNQFKVDINNIKKILTKNNSIFKDKYLLVVPNSSEDGASVLAKHNSWSSHRVNLYKSVHAIFSSNPSDRTFFLGEGTLSASELIEKCGGLKPCLHGSDAHRIEDICKPDLDRYTWIKANPNFKGLLQVIHEPKDRVIIQKEKPKEKDAYNVIKSVKFIDSNDFFQPEEIYLNPNLNVIIGGKSSGKSALLYKIAKTLSVEEVEKVQQENNWKNPYLETFIEESDFVVTLENDKEIYHSSGENRRVQYIPQMYINTISEQPENIVLQKKIKDILVDDNLLNISSQETDIEKIQEDINNTLNNMLSLKIEEEELRKKISDRPLIPDLEQELEKFTNLEREILNNANMSSEELTEYRNIVEEKNTINEEIEIVKRKIDDYNQSKKQLKSAYINFINENKDIINSINFDEKVNNFLKEYTFNLNELQNEIINKIEKFKTECEKEERYLGEQLELVETKLQPFYQKKQLQGKLNNLQLKIEEYNNELQIISQLKEDKISKRELIAECEEQIKSLLEEKYQKYKEIKEKAEHIKISEQLKVTVNISFKDGDFEEKYLDKFIRKGKINNILNGSDEIINDQDKFIFDLENYVDDIMCLFKISIEKKISELKLKKSITKEEMIKSLITEEYVQLVYDLKKGDDSLYSMSPGNRGLVLLELFLNLSQDKYPILIDQPEDNLDNRTISRELVSIIKEHKDKRQIIIVTHNANLAVLTDAENIIIANQDSSLKYNDKNRFEYLSGALECSFFKDEQKLKNMGIREHTSEILEGGREAFELREKRYGFN